MNELSFFLPLVSDIFQERGDNLATRFLTSGLQVVSRGTNRGRAVLAEGSAVRKNECTGGNDQGEGS